MFNVRQLFRPVFILSVLLFSLYLLASRSTPVAAQSPAQQFTPFTQSIAPISMDQDLRDLRSVPSAIPLDFIPNDHRRHSVAADDTSQITITNSTLTRSAIRLNMPSPSNNFDGIDLSTGGCSACPAPDTHGDVGTNQYIQAVNTAFEIWDKNGSVLQAATTFDTLWGSGGSNPCTQAKHQGQAFVFYDHIADRWVLTDVAYDTNGPHPAAPFYECIAVSKTSNPVSGGWWLYAIQVDTTNTDWLNDSPKFGLWPDAWYASYNMICGAALCTYGSRDSFQSVEVVALDRASMLTGGTATSVQFRLSPTAVGDSYSFVPATYRFGAPPSGRNEFFAAIDSPPVANWNTTLTKVHIWKFHVDFATPANSTFTQANDVTVNGFTNAWDSTENTAIVPQAGTTTKLDTVGDRLFAPLWYQNLNGAESLWASHTINATSTGNPTAVRWYQLNVTGNTVATTPTQQGDITGSSLYRMIPSLSLDKNGDMAIGYTSASGSAYPTIRYNGRLVTETLNTLGQGESILISSSGPKSNNTGWGDYSSTSIDPVDGCTFWHTNEYMSSASTSNWRTRIGNFTFASCAGVGTLLGTVTDFSTGNPISGATVKAGSTTTTTNASGVYTFTNLTAGAYNVTAVATGYVATIHNGVMVTNNITATNNFSLPLTAICGGSNVWCSITNTTGSLSWSNASTWDKNSVPATGADVMIQPYSGTYNANNFVALGGNATLHSLLIRPDANAGIGTNSNSSAQQTFVITGDVAIQSGGLLRDVSWSGPTENWAMQLGGNFINDGTMGGVSTNAQVNVSLQFNGTSAQVVGGTGGIRALGGDSGTSAIVINNTSTDGVTFSNNVNTTNAGSVNAPVTINANATVKFASSSVQFIGGGSLTFNGLTELLASTFDGHYALSGAKTIGAGSTVTYKNIASIISPTTDIPAATLGTVVIDTGPGWAELNGSAATINTLTIKSGATLTATTAPTITTFNLNDGGKYIQTTLANIPGSTRNFGGDSTYEYQTISQTTWPGANINWGNLIINVAGSTTNLSAAGNLQSVRGILQIKDAGSGAYQLCANTCNTVIITSNLSVDKGLFNFSTGTGAPMIKVLGNVTIGSQGKLQPQVSSGIPAFNVNGNWTNNGTFIAGSGTVTFTGNAEPSISGSVATAFNNLTIISTTRVVIPDTNSPTITETLIVQVGGALKQTQTVSNAAVSFLQISSLTGTLKYRGVDLTTPNNLDRTTVIISTTASNICTDTGSTSPSYAKRCYYITPTNNATTTVKLWALTAQLNSLTEANLNVYHLHNSAWVTLTNTSNGHDANNYSYAQGDTTSFSPFLLGGTTAPTAITLIDFSALSPSNGWLWLIAVLIAASALISVIAFNRNQHKHSAG
jgi:hypothetical protein